MEAVSPWLSWALERYTAVLIAAAPRLEAMISLVLAARSSVQWAPCPPVWRFHRAVVLLAALASLLSREAQSAGLVKRNHWCGAGGASWLILGRLVRRSPHIFLR